MIDRLAKIQLSIFAVITVITLSVMAIFYLRLPATFGIGTYGVSADFVAGGGLYKNANLTFTKMAPAFTMPSIAITISMRLRQYRPTLSSFCTP